MNDMFNSSLQFIVFHPPRYHLKDILKYDMFASALKTTYSLPYSHAGCWSQKIQGYIHHSQGPLYLEDRHILQWLDHICVQGWYKACNLIF